MKDLGHGTAHQVSLSFSSKSMSSKSEEGPEKIFGSTPMLACIRVRTNSCFAEDESTPEKRDRGACGLWVEVKAPGRKRH